MATEVRHFRPGQYIFREGEAPSALYIIQKGTIGIRKRKGNGFVDLAKIHVNEVVGELSFFDRLPRSASGIALTEVDALEITFDSLEKVYFTIPSYLRTMINGIVDRLRKANDVIKRLEKNVVEETEGVVGAKPVTQDEAQKNETNAILEAVTEGKSLVEDSDIVGADGSHDPPLPGDPETKGGDKV